MPYVPEPPPSASRVASGDVYTADGQLYNPEDDDPEAAFASLRPNTPPKQRGPRGPSIAERSAQWEKKQAAKREAARQEQELMHSQKCSFTPKVRRRRIASYRTKY